MIEPPRDLPVAKIVARVRDRYRMDVDDATFLPLGNDSSAWSFRLDGGGDRWFLKVFGRPVDPAAVEVPRFLAASGVHHLIPAGREEPRSEEHTSELQSPVHLVCRLLLEKKKKTN